MRVPIGYIAPAPKDARPFTEYVVAKRFKVYARNALAEPNRKPSLRG